MSHSSLERFHSAQGDPLHGYRNALAEIRTTGKRSHWIWYIFPQLAGLGQSPQARRFALAGRAEARAYLEDPRLRSRLLEISTAVADQLQRGHGLLEIMGSSIDAQKLVSSLTLFEQLSRELFAERAEPECQELMTIAERVLAAGVAQGYPRCAFTQRALERVALIP